MSVAKSVSKKVKTEVPKVERNPRGSKRIGQNVNSIGIGDRGVVTKMNKKGITMRYIPSQKEYSPQQIEQFQEKELALFTYIINQLLFQEAPKN